MGKSELNRFKAILEAKKVEVAGVLRNRDAIAVEKSADELEALQRATERELAMVSLDRGAAVLRNIRAALRRVEAETFGICVRCEKQINPRRLEAVPWAPLCIRCQEAADRGEEGARVEELLMDAA